MPLLVVAKPRSNPEDLQRFVSRSRNALRGGLDRRSRYGRHSPLGQTARRLASGRVRRAQAYGKHLESQPLLWPMDGRRWRVALVLPPDRKSLPVSMDRPVLVFNPTVFAAVYAAIPDRNLDYREACQTDTRTRALVGGPRTRTPDHQLFPCRVHLCLTNSTCWPWRTRVASTTCCSPPVLKPCSRSPWIANTWAQRSA
jgi:hypothetical protein